MSKPTPVAWTSAAQLKMLKEQPSHNHRMWGEPLPYHDDIPLYLASALQALEEENERLLAEVDAMRRKAISNAQERNAAEARLKKALKVIEPFAKAAGRFEGLPVSEQLPQQCWFTPADLRAARRFMEENR